MKVEKQPIGYLAAADGIYPKILLSGLFLKLCFFIANGNLVEGNTALPTGLKTIFDERLKLWASSGFHGKFFLPFPHPPGMAGNPPQPSSGDETASTTPTMIGVYVC
jgi:hypothetical protein